MARARIHPAACSQRGIAVGVHYPAIHLFSAYRKLGWREGMFPNAERVGRETVTLPLFPAMQDSTTSIAWSMPSSRCWE